MEILHPDSGNNSYWKSEINFYIPTIRSRENQMNISIIGFLFFASNQKIIPTKEEDFW